MLTSGPTGRAGTSHVEKDGFELIWVDMAPCENNAFKCQRVLQHTKNLARG